MAGRRVVRSGVTGKGTGSRWEVRITVCYLDIACSCMTRWETPEVLCGCYACTECMFAMKSRCKYAGCCRPRELRHLRACGQPHAASLQVVGPNVQCQRALQVVGPHVRVHGGMWAATRGFYASCRSACLGFAVWAATRGFLASCRSACIGTAL